MDPSAHLLLFSLRRIPVETILTIILNISSVTPGNGLSVALIVTLRNDLVAVALARIIHPIACAQQEPMSRRGLFIRTRPDRRPGNGWSYSGPCRYGAHPCASRPRPESPGGGDRLPGGRDSLVVSCSCSCRSCMIEALHGEPLMSFASVGRRSATSKNSAFRTVAARVLPVVVRPGNFAIEFPLGLKP